MDRPRYRETPELPPWISRLAMPVWVTTLDGVIRYMNPRAETLIGQHLTDCAGHACYLVIAGRTPEGAPLCGPRCRVRRLAAVREPIEPIPIRIAVANGRRRDVTLVVLALADDQLVHCVVDTARQSRLCDFLGNVAGRTPRTRTLSRSVHAGVLTAREHEVLTLLAQGLTQQEIGDRLSVSYVTVRNHVQHILAKLGVHSILEAIAVSLIEED